MTVIYNFTWYPAEAGITKFTLDFTGTSMQSHYEVTTDGTTNLQTSPNLAFEEGVNVHVELRAVNSQNVASAPVSIDFTTATHVPLAPTGFTQNFVAFQ